MNVIELIRLGRKEGGELVLSITPEARSELGLNKHEDPEEDEDLVYFLDDLLEFYKGRMKKEAEG